MTSMFYEVIDDTDHPTAWWLGKIQCRDKAFDPRSLKVGRPVESPGPLHVPIQRLGEPMAFSFALAFVPVVATRVAAMIDVTAPHAVQRFPIEVGHQPGEYEVLNVVRVVDAIDRERSEYLLWNPEDERADKLGKFRQVERLVLRNDVQQDAGIFRPAGWEVVLIVSATLKRALEKFGNLGVCFRPLEGGFSAN